MNILLDPVNIRLGRISVANTSLPFVKGPTFDFLHRLTGDGNAGFLPF